jgi:hypothetical protein
VPPATTPTAPLDLGPAPLRGNTVGPTAVIIPVPASGVAGAGTSPTTIAPPTAPASGVLGESTSPSGTLPFTGLALLAWLLLALLLVGTGIAVRRAAAPVL